MTGIIGSIQATEAMKVLLGIEGVLSGRLLIFNALKMESRILKFSSTRGKTNSNFSKPKIDMKITPKELERMILGGDEVFILDVRREIEESIATIKGTSARIEHLQIPSRIEELPRDLPIIVYCHSGVRSAAVVNYLSSLNDFNGAISNLEGGIDRWSREVDPNVPRY
jgi:adenylyltransferase/sulfurtransferase